MDDMSQFHEVFFEEAQEHLETMETFLLDYEPEDSPDIEALNSVFRAAHSIKGGSDIFGFKAMTGLTHVMENLLDSARNKELFLTKDLITVLLETIDLLKIILDAYHDGAEIQWDDVESGKTRLKTVLQQAKEQQVEENSNTTVSSDSTPSVHSASDALDVSDTESNSIEDEGFGFFDQDDEPVVEDLQDKDLLDPDLPNSDLQNDSQLDMGQSDSGDLEDDTFGFFTDDDASLDSGSSGNSSSASVSLDSGSSGNSSSDKVTTIDDGFGFFEQPKSDPMTQEEEQGYGFFHEQADSSTQSAITSQTIPITSQTTSIQAAQSKEAAQSVPKSASSSSENIGTKPPVKAKPAADNKTSESASIRVETVKIDKLVNLVGELVITQSMLNLIGGEAQESIAEKMQTALAELERNTREIQEAVMSVRMLPISFVFNRFPRLVRDLSNKLNKDIELVIEGGSTEIDKNLIEKISDPLTHLIRNSIDHGIELPEKRIANGKSKTGKVHLLASQKGGEIVITVSDDGAGLNKERILNKALEKGISLPDPLTDEAVWLLIFAPGFSTAAEVTDVSGRGVGMDVVKRNIEALGGRVSIESFEGQGSTFEIRLPLTLAILDGMCIQNAEQIFVIPLVNIVESIQPMKNQIKVMQNRQLLWVRDEYWPLINLQEVMYGETHNVDMSTAIVVLVETAKKRFGLIVDALVGQQQVVIKSLERHYRRVKGVAGATIMGDGSVALILDIESLVSTKSLELEGENDHVILTS